MESQDFYFDWVIKMPIIYSCGYSKTAVDYIILKLKEQLELEI